MCTRLAARRCSSGTSQQRFVERRLDPDDLREKLETLAPGFVKTVSPNVNIRLRRAGSNSNADASRPPSGLRW
jgi:hypothetical protein